MVTMKFRFIAADFNNKEQKEENAYDNTRTIFRENTRIAIFFLWKIYGGIKCLNMLQKLFMSIFQTSIEINIR